MENGKQRIALPTLIDESATGAARSIIFDSQQPERYIKHSLDELVDAIADLLFGRFGCRVGHDEIIRSSYGHCRPNFHPAPLLLLVTPCLATDPSLLHSVRRRWPRACCLVLSTVHTQAHKLLGAAS